jgi:adenine-specific DNA-methyltransferase
MPTLDWIGKAAVVNHHQVVPTKLLHCDGALSAGDPDAGNLLVEGDNLEALKALLPYYGGQVKCIYIDFCDLSTSLKAGFWPAGYALGHREHV